MKKLMCILICFLWIGVPAFSMNQGTFNNLYSQIENEVFIDDKIEILETVLPANGITCDQLTKLMKLCNHDDEKLDILEFSKMFISDPFNSGMLMEIFDFDSDKRKAQEILMSGGPSSGSFGGNNSAGSFSSTSTSTSTSTTTTTSTRSYGGSPTSTSTSSSGGNSSASFGGSSSAAPMEEGIFNNLYERIKKETFINGKLSILKTALSTNGISCNQLAKVMALCTFATDQIKLMEASLSSIADKANSAVILEVFKFNNDREKARKILANAKSSPASKGGASQSVSFVGDFISPGDLNYTTAWKKMDFNALKEKLDREPHSNKKVSLLKKEIALNKAPFISNQIVSILKTFPFGNDQLKAAKMLDERILGLTCNEVINILKEYKFDNEKIKALKTFKDTITDAENKFLILDAFRFNNDKEKARKILESIKRRSYIYGSISDKNVIFALDLSGSMNASFSTSKGKRLNRLELVILELKDVLRNQITPSHKFNIVLFESGVRTWKKSLVNGSQKNVQDAINFLSSLRADGGTNIYGALETAYSMPGADSIYFLTDGIPSTGDKTDGRAILNDVDGWFKSTNRKIHAIAFLMGNYGGENKSQSREFMRSLAEKTSGVCRGIE